MKYGYINSLFFLLVLFCTSCAKEIYTDAEAAAAKREAQKVGLTLMIRDIGNSSADLSGFFVSSLQCGEEITGTSSVSGIVDLKMIKGDAVLTIKKDGFVTATAVVTAGFPDTGADRTNTVVIIPVFSEAHVVGHIKGFVHVKNSATDIPPLENALVSVELGVDELISLAFPGLNSETGRYKPFALSYSANILQPVRTDADGRFELVVPATETDLKYILKVHETDAYCSAERTVTTNGSNLSPVSFQLTPYGK
jgi:hypothetical protein